MSESAEDPRGRHNGQRAEVVARLNNGLLRLRTVDGKEVTGHAALDLRMALTRLLPGDAVEIEVSPFDPTKARILGLAKQQEPSLGTAPRDRIQHPQRTNPQ